MKLSESVTFNISSNDIKYACNPFTFSSNNKFSILMQAFLINNLAEPESVKV